jgi:non-ribosomal peptide synthetase component F
MPVLDTKKDLSALFSLQVQATPDAVALEDDKTTYTYAELDQKVEDLAHALRSHGVKRDSLVGVLLPRSADYIIACLAALRAGGAFLVLELAYPLEMLTDVLEDAAPVVVVTYRAEVGKLKEGVPLVIIDEQEKSTEPDSNGLAPVPVETDLLFRHHRQAQGHCKPSQSVGQLIRSTIRAVRCSTRRQGCRQCLLRCMYQSVTDHSNLRTDFAIVGDSSPTSPRCHRYPSHG